MKIMLLDIKTGLTAIAYDDGASFVWTEHNLSCDCNRVNYFPDEIFDEMEKQNKEGVCWGSKRFIVIEHTFDGFSVEEFNQFYQIKNLSQYLQYKEILQKKEIL